MSVEDFLAKAKRQRQDAATHTPQQSAAAKLREQKRREDAALASERKRAFTVGVPAAARAVKNFATRSAPPLTAANLQDEGPTVGGFLRGAYDSVVKPVMDAGGQMLHGRGPVIEGLRFAAKHPAQAAGKTAETAATLTPGLGSVLTFKDITKQAAALRAAGYTEEADMLSAEAVPMSLGVLATDGTLGLAAKGLRGLSRGALEKATRPTYTRSVEGPFTKIARSDIEPQLVPEAAHVRTMSGLREIAQDPARSPAIHIANEASMRARGVPYDVNAEQPVSSLARQGAIGRAFDEAVAGSPEYKHATFERWGEMYPQLVERAKAQNLDQFTEASYNALGKEVEQQFDRLPLTMKYHTGEGEYGSPNDMMRDVLANGNLNVFSGGEPHELLNKVDPATGLSQNEMFRAVHDYMGHVVPGSQFGPQGEEAAFAAHSRTLDPLALPALLSETRGQNSWVNYSPANADIIDQMNRIKMQNRERTIALQYLTDRDPRYSEAARTSLDVLPSASEARDALHELGSRYQYAPQRAVTLPPEFLDIMTPGGQPEWMRQVMQARAPTNDVRGVHFGRTEGLSELDPRFYGSGAFSGERQMVRQNGLPDRTYFYSGPEGAVAPEDSVGP